MSCSRADRREFLVLFANPYFDQHILPRCIGEAWNTEVTIETGDRPTGEVDVQRVVGWLAIARSSGWPYKLAPRHEHGSSPVYAPCRSSEFVPR